MEDDFTRRMGRAILNLKELKLQASLRHIGGVDDELEVKRLEGKIEGMRLALDYYLEEMELQKNV